LGALLCGALAAWTLIAAVVLRLSLSAKDVEHADVKGFISVLNRGANRNVERESLALYFLTLIVTSVACYAAMYLALSAGRPASFSYPHGTGWFEWVYYSVGVVSTSSDGSILAAAPVAKLAVMAQLFTGPLLLFWFISLFIADDE
jgi:hypothetical protein